MLTDETVGKNMGLDSALPTEHKVVSDNQSVATFFVQSHNNSHTT